MRRIVYMGLVVMAAASRLLAADPFQPAIALKPAGADATVLSVSFPVPAGHHLYADRMRIEAEGGAVLIARDAPVPVQEKDPFGEDVVGVYSKDAVFTYTVQTASWPLRIRTDYQGCDESLCFLPVSRRYAVAADGTVGVLADEPAGAAAEQASWKDPAGRFTVTGRTEGYLAPADFLVFLDRVEAGKGLEKPGAASLWWSILGILLGGLLLNLTPCVLPMIPINIAIIGAGAQAGSRWRGFALGGAYGMGMAAIYGGLGLLAVLAGTRFGTLNSSPWFNAAIAALFVAMGAAMFGLFNIDFSRFQGRSGSSGERRGGYVAALLMGGVAALLAGACVAPAVISTLVLSADIYQKGNVLGLVLPFLLGAGMGLPWPFAGAGLSFLPKPGRWMEWVKYGFGVLILLFAIYYGHLAFTLFQARTESYRAALALAQQESAETGGWMTSLEQGLERARRENRPVLIDFWATWCKNCLRMEKTTFRDDAVSRRLEGYVKIKFQAEVMQDPKVREALDHFGVLGGLPTYVTLKADER